MYISCSWIYTRCSYGVRTSSEDLQRIKIGHVDDDWEQAQFSFLHIIELNLYIALFTNFCCRVSGVIVMWCKPWFMLWHHPIQGISYCQGLFEQRFTSLDAHSPEVSRFSLILTLKFCLMHRYPWLAFIWQVLSGLL